MGFEEWFPKLRAAGLSLSHFIQPKNLEDRGDPFRWPLLSLTPDQEASGVCAVGFAQRFLHCNLDETWDYNHRAWNDEKATIRDCKMQPWLLLMMISLNIFDGPWQDCGRWNECISAMRRLWASADPHQVPLFVSLLPMIAEERGEDIADPNLAWEGWKGMQEDGVLSKRGYRTNLNRFFGFHQASDRDIGQFWQKLFVLMCVCLEADYLGNSKVQKLRVAPIEDGAAPSSSSTSARFTSPEEKALRQACGNAFSIAALVHSEPANLMRWRIVHCAGRFTRLWQGNLNKELRCVSATRKWLTEQLKGSFVSTLRRVLHTTTSESDIKLIGYTIPRDNDCRAISEGMVLFEDSMAELQAHYMMRLTGNRLYQEALFLEGWPTKSVLLLDEASASDTMQLLKWDWETYQELKQRVEDNPGCSSKDFLSRHLFEIVPNQQLLQICILSGWVVTDRFRHWLEQRFAKLTQSQLAEDGFNREKRAARKQLNRTGREVLAYSSLVESRVMHEAHDYAEFDADHAALPRGATLDQTLFRPTFGCFSFDPKGLVSYSQKTPWYSPGAAKLPIAHLDLLVLREARERNRWHALGGLWCQAFFEADHNFLVRSASASDDDGDIWFVPLKSASNGMVCLWPMTCHAVPGQETKKLWRLDTSPNS